MCSRRRRRVLGANTQSRGWGRWWVVRRCVYVCRICHHQAARRRRRRRGGGMAGELIHDGGEVSSISCRSVPILKKNINCDKFIKKRLYLWWKSKQRMCLSMVLRSHFCKKRTKLFRIAQPKVTYFGKNMVRVVSWCWKDIPKIFFKGNSNATDFDIF